MDRQQWDERYSGSEFEWSMHPNQFVAEQLDGLPPGRALDLAAGEGRRLALQQRRQRQRLGDLAHPFGDLRRTPLAHLQAELGWLSDVTGIYRRDGVYRVQAGPYTDRTEALRVANRIEQALDLKPVLINR